ncbi:MAG: TerB family tellurite resistance protein [Comamonadaceae bacterium]|nr:TerB family tellurite resistance protein [Comamonadaceae bacterium]
MPLIQDQNLSASQVILLTKAMLSVALIDGLAPAEAALIGQFYETSRSGDMPSTAALLASPDARQFDVAELAGCAPDLADTVVLMCLMAAYADGRLSDAERAQVQAIAGEIGLDDARVDVLLAQVRDELIGALSHLPDAASVATVVKELAAAD